MSICWLDGELMPVDQARISVLDHGLLYGDGVFEGIRFYNRSPFRLEEHLQRLQDSAAAIGLDIPLPMQQLYTAIHDLIHASDDDDGYLRLVITRGKGPLGINPAQCSKGTTFIIADKSGFISDEIKRQGAKLVIASTRRIPPDCLDPRIKSLNYLNHILARMEANQAGADEAILLNSQGLVTEGSTDNIFIVRQNELFTPPDSDGALQGITRGIIFELAAELGMVCREKSLAPYDLYTSDECFLTGTAMELIPVRQIDGRRMASCPGETFQQLLQAFKDRVQYETHPSPQSRVSI